MNYHRKSLLKVSSLKEQGKSKFLLSLKAHKRLKSLNNALNDCSPISKGLKLKLAKKLGIPTYLIKVNIVHPKTMSNE